MCQGTASVSSDIELSSLSNKFCFEQQRGGSLMNRLECRVKPSCAGNIPGYTARTQSSLSFRFGTGDLFRAQSRFEV